MSMPSDGGYGRNRPLLWYHGLRDRLAGRHGRANARWGRVRAAEGGGRLIWIKAGAGEQGLELAAELTNSIREKRLDVRLVLTFEQEYPEVLRRRLRELRKVGFGYGPCDARPALRRVFQRFAPLAVICVERPPSANLLREAADRQVRVVAFGTPPATGQGVEAAYPASEADAAGWVTAAPGYLAPVADPLTILTPAQVDPNFRSLISGGQEFALAWVDGVSAARLPGLLAAWQAASRSRPGLLFVSGPGKDDFAALPLSRWQRDALPPGSVVHVDEARWLPAVAASADAIYLNRTDRRVFWQALAGGAPVSAAPDTAVPAQVERRLALPRDADFGEFFQRLAGYRDSPQSARQLADACRRLFWEERRRAGEVVEELLQRVYDW